MTTFLVVDSNKLSQIQVVQDFYFRVFLNYFSKLQRQILYFLLNSIYLTFSH